MIVLVLMSPSVTTLVNVIYSHHMSKLITKNKKFICYTSNKEINIKLIHQKYEETKHLSYIFTILFSPVLGLALTIKKSKFAWNTVN